jgi:hypothetical protein
MTLSLYSPDNIKTCLDTSMDMPISPMSSHGQSIDGESGENPERYRHCVVFRESGKLSQIASLGSF